MTVVFYPPTIAWSRLTQRPQQLMRAFARLGWYAVYHDFDFRKDAPPVEEIEPRLYLLARHARPEVLRGLVDPFRPVLLWVTHPPHAKLVGSLYREDLVVFDACDMPVEEFCQWGPWVKDMLARASIVFAASEQLYRCFSRLHPNVRLAPNGGDPVHFSPLVRRPVPPDFPRRAGRVAGYHGALATWVDWELVYRVASSLPHWNFVFVGPVHGLETRWLPVLPNVFYLGEKNYAELPAYVHRFDVGIVPFQVRAVTRASDPVKVYEYLAAGKPVVATHIPALEGRPGVYIARDAGEFALLLEKALGEDSETRHAERLDFAARNSWENRARYVMDEISTLLRSGVG